MEDAGRRDVPLLPPAAATEPQQQSDVKEADENGDRDHAGRVPSYNREKIDLARAAWEKGDVEASIKVHEQFAGQHDERHMRTSGDVLKAVVFGGLDGVVTIFAIVAGSVGANLAPAQVVMLGLGNLFADAVSMGAGEVSE
eukprot:GHVU01086760.1.p1 GENE.GHVU01086760.1~~GHVU01086760.1.p1  ORF type:complete len:141 (-),score=40.55 GHVU01086760.1:177-599(-)